MKQVIIKTLLIEHNCRVGIYQFFSLCFLVFVLYFWH